MPSKKDMAYNMKTGRRHPASFLKGEPISQPAFVPLIWGVLERVSGVSLDELTADPTLWANAFQKTVDLFGVEGMVVGFNFHLMAEACGCGIAQENGRPLELIPPADLCQTPEESRCMKHTLETAKRVFQVCRNERACVAALTGPVTLAGQLFGQEQGAKRIGEIKPLLVRVTEAFCQIQPDAVMFMEDRPLALSDITLEHRRIYNTLKNITHYYNTTIGLYLQGYQLKDLDRFSKLNMDFYIPGPSQDNRMPDLSHVWELGHEAIAVGVGLPLDDLEKAKSIIREGVDHYQTKGRPGVFFTSHGPVSRDVDLNMFRQIIQEIQQVRLLSS